MKKVALHTLGCKLNFAETSTIGQQFLRRGFQPVSIDDPSDVVVINTCSVTERADRECRQLVRRALRHSPDAFVVVTGCYAQLQPQEISSIPGVDLVLGASEKFSLFEHAGDFQKRGSATILTSPIDQVHRIEAASSADFADRTRAFLKIQDGCDFNCAFCTIPLARGESRSVPMKEIVGEAVRTVNHGYKEIVLTGVNVGDYGKKSGSSLLALLQELKNVDGLERIRISSIEPNLLDDRLVDFWTSEPKICKHFHIPLQSGTDRLLKSMRRRYRTNWYAGRVQAIKSVLPDAGIGVDVIVGFPGETDELFQETFDFLLGLPVSYLHVFTYSERPRTPAPAFPGRVEPAIRAERSERLRMLSLRKKRVFSESFVGKTVEVLFEDQRAVGSITGLTGEYVRVKVATHMDLTNRILGVNIVDADESGCVGKLCGAPVQESCGKEVLVPA